MKRSKFDAYTKPSMGIRKALCATAFVGLACAALPAAAEFNLLDTQGLKLTAGFTAAAYGVYSADSNFGAGTTSIIDGKTRRDQTNGEGYIKPNLTGTYDFANKDYGQLYGSVSAPFAASRGDGDPAGFTLNASDVGVDDAYIGWRGSVLDVSVGRQRFTVGNQFLIGWGNFSSTQRDGGNYWQVPYLAFPMTAIIKANLDPVHAQLFLLQGDVDFSYKEVGGLNFEYWLGKDGANGKLGAMVLKTQDAKAGSGFKGRETFDVRGLDIQVPYIPGLSFSAEYALQRGDDNAGTKYDADAWYIWPQYQFTNVAWKPTIGVRYGIWSGDKASSAGTNEGWDQIFGFFPGFGTWYQGEIAGQYLLINSNQRSLMAKVDLSPMDNVTIHGIYFNHQFDDLSTLKAAGVTSRDYLDELNLVVEWTPTPSWYVFGAFAYAMPGKGGAQYLGNNKDWSVVEGEVMYTF
jgi:hypothetical protein